ncbi:MAG TPA: TetR/AcrR family transcriptional regulator [Terracidiphilus sp.]|nr:TetR/AcrR family transcriptional regulator [Terracidiphilus sp.]
MDAKNETSREIFSCALQVLEAEGAQAVTMRRVAKEIGVTPMAIYHHYKNREALLGAVVDSEFEQLAEYFRRPMRQRTFEEQVVHIMDGYLDYALAHPRIFDYVFSTPRPGARRYPRDFRARRSPTLNILADTVRSLIREKRLKQDDVWEIAMQLWAHVHGYLMLYRAGRFELSEREFRNLVHRSLRRSLYGFKS